MVKKILGSILGLIKELSLQEWSAIVATWCLITIVLNVSNTKWSLFILTSIISFWIFIKKELNIQKHKKNDFYSMLRNLNDEEKELLSILLFCKNCQIPVESYKFDFLLRYLKNCKLLELKDYKEIDNDEFYLVKMKNKYYLSILKNEDFRELFDEFLIVMKASLNILFFKDKKCFIVNKKNVNDNLTVFFNGKALELKGAEECVLTKNKSKHEITIKGTRLFKEEDNYLFNNDLDKINLIITNNVDDKNTFVYLKGANILIGEEKDKFTITYTGKLNLVSIDSEKEIELIRKENLIN